jgi:hypothetical protein
MKGPYNAATLATPFFEARRSLIQRERMTAVALGGGYKAR